MVADAGENEIEEAKEVGSADGAVVVFRRFHRPVEKGLGDLREDPTIVDRPIEFPQQTLIIARFTLLYHKNYFSVSSSATDK